MQTEGGECFFRNVKFSPSRKFHQNLGKPNR
jgi:hypothetical protein